MRFLPAALKKQLGKLFRRQPGGARPAPPIKPIRWFEPSSPRPRALVQVSPAVQPNGVFVNYGDQIMYWGLAQALERHGFAVRAVPRVALPSNRLEEQQASLFVDLGGFIYSGAHHQGMKSIEAAGITYQNSQSCRAAGGFVASAPQTFGPYSPQADDELRRAMGRLIGAYDVVFARDQRSILHLQDIAALDPSKVHRSPDLGFLFQAQRQRGPEVLQQAGIKADQGAPMVGIIPNRQISQRSPAYLSEMKDVIRFLQGEGAQVVMIPHERGRFGGNEKDDQHLCRQLAGETGAKSLARARTDVYPSEHDEEHYIHGIEDAIGCLDFVVSGRFHGALRALSEQVPTVVCSWAHKYPPLFADLELPVDLCVLSDLHEPSATAGHAVAGVRAAWNERHALRTTLSRTVPQVRAQAENCVATLVALSLAHPRTGQLGQKS